ncbi:unnamed protein product [Sphagnum jensenii]
MSFAKVGDNGEVLPWVEVGAPSKLCLPCAVAKAVHCGTGYMARKALRHFLRYALVEGAGESWNKGKFLRDKDESRGLRRSGEGGDEKESFVFRAASVMASCSGVGVKVMVNLR